MKTKMLGILAVFSVLLALVVVPSFAKDGKDGGKWKEKTGTIGVRTFHYTIYVDGDGTESYTICTIGVGKTLKIIALESVGENHFSQRTEIRRGNKKDHLLVAHYPYNWSKTWDHYSQPMFEDSSYDIFAARCAKAAKKLPKEVRKKFYGYYGIK